MQEKRTRRQWFRRAVQGNTWPDISRYATPGVSGPSVGIQIASGVNVFVQLDPNSRMTVVQALEAALADAKARSESAARPRSDQVKFDTAERGTHRTKPPASADHDEADIAELRKKNSATLRKRSSRRKPLVPNGATNRTALGSNG